MATLLWDKLKEVTVSVLPILAIVVILQLTHIIQLPDGIFYQFIIAAILIILGLAFFMLGADMGVLPIGEMVGSTLSERGKMSLMLGIGFLVGFMVTVAEPDVQVLAKQIYQVGPDISQVIIIGAIAIGVGVFMAVGLFRTAMQIPLRTILIVAYGTVFILAYFTPGNFLAMSFDSGGVTTGPMTVPFILALGVGVAAARGGNSSAEDSFGLVALGSIGPIMATMIIGVIYRNEPVFGELTPASVETVTGVRDLVHSFIEAIPENASHVLLSLTPLLVMFLLFQFLFLKLQKTRLLKIFIGLFYTFIGLVIFLLAVNVGFLPAGSYIGKLLAEASTPWILLPVGMVLGFCVVFAEPAVHVLNREIADVSGGHISTRVMLGSLSIGVAIAVGISMVRIITGLSIWYVIIPGYAIAIILSFFAPKMFTAIAFDSGGVVSGPMTATFLSPLAIGACEALGGEVLKDAFGLVAMVAMIPLIVIQCVGLIYDIKAKRAAERFEEDTEEFFDELLSEIGEIVERDGKDD